MVLSELKYSERIEKLHPLFKKAFDLLLSGKPFPHIKVKG